MRPLLFYACVSPPSIGRGHSGTWLLGVGFRSVPVRLYTPPIRTYFRCGQEGHAAQYCKSRPTCTNCGQPHPFGECPNRGDGGGPSGGDAGGSQSAMPDGAEGVTPLFPHAGDPGLSPAPPHLGGPPTKHATKRDLSGLDDLIPAEPPCDVLLLQDTPDSLCSKFGGLPGHSLFLP